MSRKVIVLPEADRDIDEAFGWYVDEAGLDVAARFLDAVQGATSSILEMPGMGRRWPFLKPRTVDLRSWPLPTFKRYLIFYREVTDGIELVRVLHGMRDLETILDAGK